MGLRRFDVPETGKTHITAEVAQSGLSVSHREAVEVESYMRKETGHGIPVLKVKLRYPQPRGMVVVVCPYMFHESRFFHEMDEEVRTI